jgi:hypothetical protein
VPEGVVETVAPFTSLLSVVERRLMVDSKFRKISMQSQFSSHIVAGVDSGDRQMLQYSNNLQKLQPGIPGHESTTWTVLLNNGRKTESPVTDIR